MPSLTTKPVFAIVMLWCLLVLSLAGCGDNNAHSSYDPDRGAHPDDWLPARHAVAALGRLDDCRPCHGTDFSGGISKVACTQCHLGNETDVHPLEWGAHDYAEHGDWIRQALIQTGRFTALDLRPGVLGTTLLGAASEASARCATAECHGADYRGAANSGPSCFDDQPGVTNSSCHIGNAFSVHPLDWFPPSASTRAGIVPTILPAHGSYVNTYGAAECSIPVCHGSGTGTAGPTTVIRVGIGSTRITGTTPTTPNFALTGFTGFTGFTTATTATGTGPGEAVVRNTGRFCAACHF